MAIRARVPVYNYKQSFAAVNLAANTAYNFVSNFPSYCKEVIIDNTGGAPIDFLIGNSPNQNIAFTIPDGGGKWSVPLNPGMSLWLKSATLINQGNLIITGIY